MLEPLDPIARLVASIPPPRFMSSVETRAEGAAERLVPGFGTQLFVREAGEASTLYVAEARFLLARALIQAKASSARAVALGERARDAFVEAVPAREQLAEVETFLREHPPAR